VRQKIFDRVRGQSGCEKSKKNVSRKGAKTQRKEGKWENNDKYRHRNIQATSKAE